MLQLEGRAPVRLTREDAPLAFPGDAAATARLVEGTIRDLNLMSRRGSVVQAMTRLHGELTELRVGADATALIFCAAPNVTVEAAQAAIKLARHDTAICGCGMYRVHLAAAAEAFLCTVDTLR